MCSVLRVFFVLCVLFPVFFNIELYACVLCVMYRVLCVVFCVVYSVY